VKTILLTCGETSGDHHAAGVVRGIRSIDPRCRIVALGGGRLRDAGADVAFPMEEYAFMGFSEVLHGLPRVLYLERRLKSMLGRGDVDLFMPVDYPGLNLRLARHAHKHSVPVLYFISPQVWAWGEWRIRRMKGSVDLMAVILPFEEEIYRKAGIPVVFTGHPMLGEIDEPGEPKRAPSHSDEFTVLLFPGSREQEVERLLPPVFGAVRILQDRFPRASFRLGLAPLIREDLAVIPADLAGRITITREGIGELGSAALVLAASGTVTLQSALSGTPMVVFYKTSPFTYAVGNRLVRIPHIAMPNVLAGKMLVPELIQRETTPMRIADEASALLGDAGRYHRISAELIALRTKLAGTGGISLVARIALELAGGKRVEEVMAAVRAAGG
jgi:lipid-A-disaccharide synthase